MVQFRQGDVLIQATDKPIPGDTVQVPRDGGRVVLAYGEVTGHAHAIADPQAVLLAPVIPDMTDAEIDTRFLQITGTEPAVLAHEEHSPITLPPGNYVVRRQRRYRAQAEPLRVVD